LCDAAYNNPQEIESKTRALANINRKENIMNITRSFANWRMYRQTVVELGRMSNRELNDLGIARSDINRVAREAVR
jgi:uncharacterized protein YjiS (DUF1127 family)